MSDATDEVIEQSEGYRKLRAAILADTKNLRSEAERMRKLTFAVDRAKHYADKTGIDASEILTAWESRRDYWYMNYYQDANQPEITGDSVRVFETVDDATAAIGKAGYRCPYCKAVSSDPYECNSGVEVKRTEDGKQLKVCNWKVYGLFGHLGKGVSLFIKDQLRIATIFMPVAWEAASQPVEG